MAKKVDVTKQWVPVRVTSLSDEMADVASQIGELEAEAASLRKRFGVLFDAAAAGVEALEMPEGYIYRFAFNTEFVRVKAFPARSGSVEPVDVNTAAKAAKGRTRSKRKPTASEALAGAIETPKGK